MEKSPSGSSYPPAARENAAFLREQIITCIGNKRALLGFIGQGLAAVQQRLGRQKLAMADLFAGSGIVARFFKAHAESLYVNDLEPYAACISSCYLTNRSEADVGALGALLPQLREQIREQWQPGFIAEMYAPADDENIRPGERVFYTRRNAVFLDTARRVIGGLPQGIQRFFLAPLLYEASVHVNTGGVFKGFYKNGAGVGQFGGRGRQALSRIMADIELKAPVFSSFECPVCVMNRESAEAAQKLPDLDLVYLDPPYNQHPYGSNYFMLNLLSEYRRPEHVSAVSGIPDDWHRSAYNKAGRAKQQLFSLIRDCRAKFLMLSYNSEGFVSYDELLDFLRTQGRVRPIQTEYNTFRGCRHLSARPLKVREYLFLLEKS